MGIEVNGGMKMYRINQIRIAGFRRLLSVDLPVKPFMVLIGANGVGKTTFLDAFATLSASASGNLNSSLSRFGGIANILTRGRAEEFSFLAEMNVPGHQPIEYDLHLAAKGTGYNIPKEVLAQRRPGFDKPFTHIDSADGDIRYYEIDEGRIVRPNWEHNPLETSLAQVPKMFRQPEELRLMLATATQYHVLDVGSRAPVKLPQPMRPATLPGTDGEELVSYLYYLRETNRRGFDMITDSLRAAFPSFEELSFPPVAAGMLAMTWKDRNFDKPIYMNELSEGTLRFLWLASLLQSPNLSAVTMIDEPEVSLHPELLNILSELMREASRRTQLIVATHSDRLIRFLKPEEVVVMDIDDEGFASALWADSLDLEEWLAEYSLDDVWRMGRMGGRS
jgi:predicted ATPase